jgi:hypothetical protein
LAAILEFDIAKAARFDAVALGLAHGGSMLFKVRFLSEEEFVDLYDFAT